MRKNLILIVAKILALLPSFTQKNYQVVHYEDFSLHCLFASSIVALASIFELNWTH
jgi:hypothetical protein